MHSVLAGSYDPKGRMYFSLSPGIFFHVASFYIHAQLNCTRQTCHNNTSSILYVGYITGKKGHWVSCGRKRIQLGTNIIRKISRYLLNGGHFSQKINCMSVCMFEWVSSQVWCKVTMATTTPILLVTFWLSAWRGDCLTGFLLSPLANHMMALSFMG